MDKEITIAEVQDAATIWADLVIAAEKAKIEWLAIYDAWEAQQSK